MPWFSELTSSKQAGKREVSRVFISETEHLASQRHMPMSLYTRMLLCQAFHIGPELEEVKKRVDELQVVVQGFAEAILDVEPEELIEEVITTDHQSA
jgi:hypothetical protein